jgi:hypothetical protein
MSTQASTPSSHPNTSEFFRRAEREERRRELISTLRKLAALASLEHYDEPTLAGRAKWSRLVEHVDQELRKQLCNKKGRAA